MDAQDELSKRDFREVSYDDTVEAQDVDPENIVKYPLQMREELFTTHSFEETEADKHADPAVRKM